VLAGSTGERWGRDPANLLEKLPGGVGTPGERLGSPLSAPGFSGKGSLLREGSAQNFVPAATPAEISMAPVWSEMFGLAQVSVEENFFDLGGHSLLLVKLHRRLKETVYPELSIVALFEHPTVRSLARHLDRTTLGTAAGPARDSQERARQQKQ